VSDLAHGTVDAAELFGVVVELLRAAAIRGPFFFTTAIPLVEVRAPVVESELGGLEVLRLFRGGTADKPSSCGRRLLD
jgi:hypothetical protein